MPARKLYVSSAFFHDGNLAVGTALALTAIDVVFVARGVIAPVYLADTAVQVVLVVWWAVARAREPAPAA